jgi:N-acetylglutamate synthase-like GNAT family acetyltransferase
VEWQIGEVGNQDNDMNIREASQDDLEWITERVLSYWGDTRMVLRGELVDAAACPALVAEDGMGFMHYRTLRAGVSEIVTLEAVLPFQGIGTALVEAHVARSRAKGINEIVVVTTNDNLSALRFYQRRGFVIKQVRLNALEEARRLKPEIPLVGNDGIPIRD